MREPLRAPGTEREQVAEPAARSPVWAGAAAAGNGAIGRLLSGAGVSPSVSARPLVRHETGVLFSDDPAFIRVQLEEQVDKHGVDALGRFESGLYDGELADPEYLGVVMLMVRDQVSLLRADIVAFREDFQRRANQMLETVLAESERRVREQLDRFGIKADATTVLGVTLWTSYTGANNDEGKRIAAAVQPLRAKLPGVIAAKAELDTVTESSMKSSTPNPGAVDAAQAKFGAAQRDYDLARNQAETAHPVLQAYNLDPHHLETAPNLERLSSDAERATVLGDQLTTELRNIARVRAEAAGNPEYVWGLQHIVGLTRQLPDLAAHPKLPNPGAQGSAVAEKTGAADATKELVAVGRSVVLIGLGVLAGIPTGGMSLAGSTAIVATRVAAGTLDAALALRAYQDYRLDVATAGTDYERAKLITQDAPEVFWLALQLLSSAVGAAGGVQGVRQLMRRIINLRHQALVAKGMRQASELQAAEGYAKLLDDLEKVGDEAQPGAGARLREEVETAPIQAETKPVTADVQEPGTGLSAVPAQYRHHQLSPAEQALTQKKIVKCEPLDKQGKNKSFLVTFEDGTHGVYKPDKYLVQARATIPVEGIADREVAASRLNEMMGLDRVPTTTRIVGPEGPGSVQVWVEDSTKGLPAGLYPPEQGDQLAVLDYIMGNTDRITGNRVTGKDGSLIGIDHGNSFPRGTMDPIWSPFVKDRLGADLDWDLLEKVRAMNVDELYNTLLSSGIDPGPAYDACKRLREIQAAGKITGEAHAGRIVRNSEEWEAMWAKTNTEK